MLDKMFDKKVFGIGMGRTGSLSLTRALGHLGVSTVHYPDDRTKRELLAGSATLSVLKSRQGLVDGIAPFYAHLDRCYPGSKFICTTRDVDGYARSRLRMRELLCALRPKVSPLHREFLDRLETGMFGTVDPGEETIREGFERHLAGVAGYFRERPDDILFMDIPGGDGWEVLCPFLSADVPGSPFPSSNTSEDIMLMTRRVDSLWNDVHEMVPAGAKCLIVDDSSLGLHFASHEARPFPHRDGVWWGAPADSETAIRELENERAQGARYVVFAWPSFWWFEHYPEFRHYLEEHFEVLARNDHCVVFDCRSGEPMPSPRAVAAARRTENP